jgi:hypothetical protein
MNTPLKQTLSDEEILSLLQTKKVVSVGERTFQNPNGNNEWRSWGILFDDGTFLSIAGDGGVAPYLLTESKE